MRPEKTITMQITYTEKEAFKRLLELGSPSTTILQDPKSEYNQIIDFLGIRHLV